MPPTKPPELPGRLAGYVVQAAREEDAPALAACAQAAYKKYVLRNGLVPVPMRQDYEEVVRDWQVWLVEHDGRAKRSPRRRTCDSVVTVTVRQE